MKTKIALVTGGTSGVGLSIVKELVQHNFYVHFVGTNSTKGKAIEAELNNNKREVSKFVKVDLSNLKETLEFTNKFKNEVSHLNILLNVAGVMLPNRQETNEGVEKTFAINYLSAFLLSKELEPLLEKGKHSRILNVSGMPFQVLKEGLSFEDLNFVKNYKGMGTAILTVHAKTVLTQILAEKFKHKNIDVNAFHPGTVKSNLGRNMTFPMSSLFKMVVPFMSNKSKSGIYASLSDKLIGVTGQLIVKEKAIPLNYDQAYKDKLWTETEKIIEKVLG
jgi:NAD(P)-dependent dehydrogenase (short-subunit alcohol dehydrogenase family)